MTEPVAVCYGTRPQIIKASRLCPALRDRWPVVRIDTGQHYDYLLNEVFYRQLGVDPPDHLLEVASGTHAEQTAAILTRSAALLSSLAPAAVVVIGDTNSTLGCALAAAQLRIPIVHVEAGLRAADRLMAEDLNRRMVDAVASVLCAPSATAEAALRRENAGGLIRRTGDIARDVLLGSLPLVPDTIPQWPAIPAVLATLHRAELTDRPDRLGAVLEGLGRLELPVIFPAHPRTRDRIERHGLTRRVPRNVRLRSEERWRW
jgi:UDP-N-acetylglucosamine 2-epimerase